MIQKIDSFLTQLISPLLGFVLVVTILNYNETIKINSAQNAHVIQQAYDKQYTVRRLYSDSIEIIKLTVAVNKANTDIILLQNVLKQIKPDLYRLNENNSKIYGKKPEEIKEEDLTVTNYEKIW